MDKQISFYLGKEKKNGFIGYLAEDDFFLIIEIDQDYEKEKGNNLILDIKQKLHSKIINNLEEFDNFIQKIIIENNLPSYFSLAAIIFKEKIAYLKTINEGKIFCKRDFQMGEIISGNESASGYIKFNDIFVLTTKKLAEKLKIEDFLNYKNTSEIIEAITPILKNNDDSGLISLFIQIKKEEQKEDDFYSDKKSFFYKIRENFKISFFNRGYQPKTKKTVVYFVLLIIFLIFVWSVILGYQRRKDKEINLHIQKIEKQILNKLSQAEEVAFLNLNEAKKLINEANDDFINLKKEIKKDDARINKIEKIILEKENQIIKKQTKNYQEFYDLTVDEKDALGEKFFLDNDFLYILDGKNGTIYKLSLEKKSLIKFKNEKIKKAKNIAAYDEKIYFFVEGEGVYEMIENEVKKVIDEDKDWGKIEDIYTYNGNLYLLDIKKDEVYKYIHIDKNFSTKISYFKSGESVDLEGAHSLAIDSYLYIGFSKFILKFNQGVKESFKNSFPTDDFKIDKIYTDKNISKIYVFDKVKGIIYILTKDGEYQEQIFSNIIKKADDFLVYKNRIFLLIKNKIYFIE